ncbi:hypothetical protein AZF37_07670 [endosymbiont 'TC1' of Trimyema compressum]|uniref:hypothetical protein n=1 Tax=endosymbiont 'TC1' of Trimyema compressum TaxID=243899 RepID=UPI0007F17BEC|nr:hypothetical protein [endosymbiont 'TC1' of Trimyema compressum]AMP21057.1 hypothetical protein AZF37_07670 [endosymbiont 'TC1' of Trimyema compressum]
MVRILHNIFELIADAYNRMVGFLAGFYQSYLNSPYALVPTIIGLLFCIVLLITGILFLIKSKQKIWLFCIVFAIVFIIINCVFIINLN